MFNHEIHVLSGSLRKVNDMIQRQVFRIRSLKMFIIDETDEMLGNFKEAIYDIFHYLPYNI